MLVGVPGSGKSTYAKKFNEQQNGKYTIVSRDNKMIEFARPNVDYTTAFKEQDAKFVDAMLNACFQASLANKEDIIIDMTNLTTSSRRRTLSQVGSDYTKYVLYFPITEELMLQRAEARKAEGKNIPEHVLKDMLKRFEMPIEEEGFNMIGVIHG